MRLLIALLIGLALASAVAQDVVNSYTSRDDYAEKNDVELSETLVAATIPNFCKAGSTIFMEDTDLLGGDIPPTLEVQVSFDVGGGDIFPDTVVAASTAEACCTMCYLTPDCGAFTFTGPENCASAETPWLFATGFEEQASNMGATSGVLPAPASRKVDARCELLLESDTSGADLTFDPILPDLVVPGSSASDCCNACASIEGCGAFTLTPARYCQYRLGKAAPGCCFLKPKKGWDATSNNDTRFFTSGALLGL